MRRSASFQPFHGWVSQRRDLRFDATQDVPGPFSLAVSLQRGDPGHEQRIVVVGSGAFLSNAYSGNGGNLDLGLNMVHWLSNDDSFIAIRAKTSPDQSFTLTTTAQIAIGAGFLFGLPLLLLGSGVFIWLRRRKR